MPPLQKNRKTPMRIKKQLRLLYLHQRVRLGALLLTTRERRQSPAESLDKAQENFS